MQTILQVLLLALLLLALLLLALLRLALLRVLGGLRFALFNALVGAIIIVGAVIVIGAQAGDLSLSISPKRFIERVAIGAALVDAGRVVVVIHAKGAHHLVVLVRKNVTMPNVNARDIKLHPNRCGEAHRTVIIFDRFAFAIDIWVCNSGILPTGLIREDAITLFAGSTGDATFHDLELDLMDMDGMAVGCRRWEARDVE